MSIDKLFDYIPEKGKLLWVIEEAECISTALIHSYAERSHVLCNRFDIYQNFKKSVSTTLSDFELELCGFDAVIFYVSKERLISHYVIASCAKWLNANGQLIILGRKNEGIKNYFAKLSARRKLKKHGDLYIGSAARPQPDSAQLATYRQHHKISSEPDIYSKPGIFSWKKLDQGSRFLIDSIKESKIDFSGRSAIDLGCAYGYLGLEAARMGASSIAATDNNVTAIKLCEHNFELNAVKGRAFVDDCAENTIATNQQKFDLVLCNPPFHKGKNTESTLTERFIQAAAELLEVRGEAYFVVNAFIPIEKHAQKYFGKIQLLKNNAQFKTLYFSN